MKNKRTYYLLILDKSGSMSDVVTETISGFNEQVQMIAGLSKKFPDQEFFTSLTTFNHEVEHVFVLNGSESVPLLTRRNYVPDGCTALLDAIGESVMSLKSMVGKELDNNEATAVVVIMTDGHENASKCFNWDTIRKVILELEETGNWSFSFIGATADSIETAARMNIKRNNAVIFEKEKVKETFDLMNSSLEEYAVLKSKGRKPKDFLK